MTTEPQAAVQPAPPAVAGMALAVIAGLSIFCALFFLSPAEMSSTQQNDDSPLASVINLMSLSNDGGTASRFSTPRGVEIRDLFFHLGAAALTVVMGLVFLLRPPSYALESQHVLDIKRQAQNPVAWFVLLLFISLVSSFFSESPDISMGGVILRLITFGWWLPLALLLQPQQAQRLAWIMAGVLALVAAFGFAYWLLRDVPQYSKKLHLGLGVEPRLIFPMGNSTLLGACMLPGVFIGLSWLANRRTGDTTKGAFSYSKIFLGIPIALLCLWVLYLTSGRAAQIGVIAGVFMILVGIVPKSRRLIVALLFVLVAVAGINYVNNLRVSGVMGDRSHSIRSRLNYEWPYAVTLWSQKLVGGHGEGGYTMKTGPLVRNQQLEDPNVLAIDSFRWTAHAHNEYLELLANLGVAGAVGFLAALVLTFWQALRWLDQNDQSGVARGLVIALMAALFAMAIEEGASVSLHKPGFPPLFFTTWACLFALTRSAWGTPAPAEKTQNSERNVRILGAASMLFAIGIGYAGVQHWRGTRAQQRANELRMTNEFEAAIALHDFAGNNILDPLQRIIARQNAVEARVVVFSRNIEAAPEVTDKMMEDARDAFILWSALDKAVPRFIDMSHIAWRLEFARSRAFARKNDTQRATACILDYAALLAQCRADEPFTLPYLQRLWSDYVVLTPDQQVIPSLDPRLRWQWLREYLRRNEIDPSVQTMIRSLTRYPIAMQVFNDFVNIATQDAEKDPDEWNDKLAPETLRLGAEIAKLNGQPNALNFADTAIKMYEAAGGRLFKAHAAALRESAQIMLVQDPDGDPTEALKRLVIAYEVQEGALPGSDEEKIARPLPGALGQTRLALLLASGDEAAARKQIAELFSGSEAEQATQLATAYLRLAESFANASQHAERALGLVAKAEALAQPTTASRLLTAQIHLLAQNQSAALDAARAAIEISDPRDAAFSYLQQLEQRYPDAPLWQTLRNTYTDFPPPPEPVAPPTTQPADADAADAGSADVDVTDADKSIPTTSEALPVNDDAAPVNSLSALNEDE